MPRYAKPKGSIKMIVDWDRCISVAPGDERLFRKSIPYKCFDCERIGDYNGKLIFVGDPIPVCQDHRRSYRPSGPDLVGSHRGTFRGTIGATALGG